MHFTISAAELYLLLMKVGRQNVGGDSRRGDLLLGGLPLRAVFRGARRPRTGAAAERKDTAILRRRAHRNETVPASLQHTGGVESSFWGQVGDVQAEEGSL